MAYLEGYDHDVFVSYGHGPIPFEHDRRVSQDPLTKWTHKFVDDLRNQIDFFLGIKDPQRRVDIWMDPALEGNQPLGANLKGKVERSALLLVAMSHFYVRSEWCGKEVEWFSTRTDTDGRLFVARVCPTQLEWPKSLKDDEGNELPGYAFHPAVEPGQLCNPYGWPKPTEGDKEYWAKLIQLAHEITKQLRRLEWIEGQSGKGHDLTSVPPSVGRTLFLGFMHDTLVDDGLRSELRSALTDQGFTVLPPEVDEPYDEVSLRTAITKYLDELDGLVVVANEYGGHWPRGEIGGFVGFQLEGAQRRQIPSYCWLKVDDVNKVNNPAYREFLEKLESISSDHILIFRDKDASKFLANIQKVLGRIGASDNAGRTGASDNARPDIFISYAREDQARVTPLVEALKRQGWSVFWDREIPPGEDWDSHIGSALEGARCVIAVWSKHSVKSSWVRNEAEDGHRRRVLVPVRFDLVLPPLPFRHINAADLSTWTPQSPLSDSFLGALRKRLGR